MSSSPQRARPAVRFGPCRLPPRLLQPTIAVDTASTIAQLEPIGEKTIHQKLGTDAPRFQVTGEVDRIRHANAIDYLTAGGPVRVVADRLDSGAWAFAERVSTSPKKAFYAEGQPGWQYEISLVGTQPPADGNANHPLPDAATAAPGRPNPPARRRPTARIGGTALPNPLNHPFVSVDSEAELAIHEPLNRPAVVRWKGQKARHISIAGTCFREQALAFDNLVEGDGISVRTDRFRGNAIVESTSTTPWDGFPGGGERPGQTYQIELQESVENPAREENTA